MANPLWLECDIMEDKWCLGLLDNFTLSNYNPENITI